MPKLTTKTMTPLVRTAVTAWVAGLAIAFAAAGVGVNVVKKVATAGTLNLQQSYYSPVNTNLYYNSYGNDLLAFNAYSSGEPIKISQIKITAVGAKGTAKDFFKKFSNLKLYLRDYRYDGYGYGYENLTEIGKVAKLSSASGNNVVMATATFNIPPKVLGSGINSDSSYTFVLRGDVASDAINGSVSFQIANNKDVIATGTLSKRPAIIKANVKGTFLKVIGAPMIKVLSPNGGEKWQFDKSYDITWKATNIDANTAYIYLWFLDGGMCYLGSISPANIGKYPVKFKENQPCQNIPSNIKAGPYKIRINTNNDDPHIGNDSSDAPFSIVASTVASSQLSVMLNSDNPSAKNITINSINQEVLRLKFIAVSNSVKINSIKISVDDVRALNSSSEASGVTFTNLKLYDGTTQLGTTKAFTDGSPDYATFNGLNLNIPKGMSKVLSVKVQAGGGSGTYYFGVVKASDIIVSDGTSAGGAVSLFSQPLVGNGMTLSSSGKLIISNMPISGATGGLGNGTKTVFKASFVAQGEDIEIRRIVLTKAGSLLDQTFDKFVIYNADTHTKIGESYLNSGKLSFQLSATAVNVIPAGAGKTYEITSEIIGSINQGDALRFSIESASDIEALGKTSNGTNMSMIGLPVNGTWLTY